MDRAGQSCAAWRCLLELLAAERSRLPAIASDLGLSEAQCQVLQALDPRTSVPMYRVAERLDCDPSNVTGIVRRLEARGLVERRVSPADRRVKKLALTARGGALRARLLTLLAEPPPGIRLLSAADQGALHAILERALASGRAPEERRGAQARAADTSSRRR